MSWFGNNENTYSELDTPSTLSECNACARESLEKLDKLKDSPDWARLDFDDENIKIWDKTEDGSTVNRLKMSFTLPYSAMQFVGLLRSIDLDLLQKWDPDLKEKKHLEKIGPGVDILYSAYNAPWPVAGRDFLFLQTLRERDSTMIHLTFSINSNKYQGNPAEYVRGVVYSAWYITPISESQCKVVRVVEMDPKGLIPAMIVQSKKLCAAKQIVALREYST